MALGVLGLQSTSSCVDVLAWGLRSSYFVFMCFMGHREDSIVNQ